VKERVFVKLLSAFLPLIVIPMGLAVFLLRQGWAAGNAVLASVAVGLLLAIVIASMAASDLAQGFVRIRETVERLASGDWNARAPQPAGGENGEVVAALERMAARAAQDIAALHTSRRQLETLLNSMEDAVIAISPDNRLQWTNQRMDSLVRTRFRAPVVETVRDPDFLRAIRGANEMRKVLTARATSIVPGRTFDVTAAPMPGGGAVAVLRDLTETERMEKTRRDFIANVSHELRTPLTSIQGYAETLLDGSSENHAREFLEIIRKNASRMARLTEDLLTLARVESGEQRFDIEPVPPAEPRPDGRALRGLFHLVRASLGRDAARRRDGPEVRFAAQAKRTPTSSAAAEGAARCSIARRERAATAGSVRLAA